MKRVFEHFRQFDLAAVLSLILVCLFPCVFVYTQNVDVAAFTDTLPILGMYLGIAAAVTAVGMIFFRNFSRSALFADAVMLVVVNFSMLSNALMKHFLWYSPVYLAVLFIVILLALLVLILVKKPDLRIACTLVAIAFGAVTFMNLALAVPSIIKKNQKTDPAVLAAEEQETAAQAQSSPRVTPAVVTPEAAQPAAVDASAEEPEAAAAEESSAAESGDASAEEGAAVLNEAEEPAEPEEPEEPVAENVFTAEKQPNVYYFIFDEYGGYENLLHYFNYDNSEFLNALEAKGFTVSRDSLNTEAIYTNTLVPNLMNLNYVMTAEEYGDEDLRDYYLDDSYLVQTFLDNGYQVNLADHLDFIGHTGCNVLTSNQTEKTIDDILVGNSIFSKFDKSEANYYDQVMDVMNAEKNSWQYAQDQPTFTIGYLQLPHSPLAFNADGSTRERKVYYNWRDDNNYLGQLEYTSDYILELMDIIQEHDPDALIILQSDHGCRYPIHQIQVGNITDFDPEVEYPHVENILNCVYYKGETFEIAGQTGINTLRRSLNQVLGTHFADLEPVYSWYNMSANITQFE